MACFVAMKMSCMYLGEGRHVRCHGKQEDPSSFFFTFLSVVCTTAESVRAENEVITITFTFDANVSSPERFSFPVSFSCVSLFVSGV